MSFLFQANLSNNSISFPHRPAVSAAERTPKAKPGCTLAGLKKADLCGEKLFFAGENARIYPKTEAEVESFCKETTDLIGCVKRFSDKCSLNDLQKNLANVMLFTVRSTNKNTCGSKSKRNNMMAMSGCANAIRKQSTACMNKMLTQFGHAQVLKQQQYRVPYACW